MEASLAQRRRGEQHQWSCSDVVASVKQIRIGANASRPERRYAQATCEISALLVWDVFVAGTRTGGLGTEAAPHQVKDLWVLERCVVGGDDDQPPPSWRLKVRLRGGEAGGGDGGGAPGPAGAGGAGG